MQFFSLGFFEQIPAVIISGFQSGSQTIIYNRKLSKATLVAGIRCIENF
ncbi:MAG: hypothetical protein QG640_681 [Patescibacteria group bacterium]|nr:hypothetical protein [Patescibacteria group bacterium]